MPPDPPARRPKRSRAARPDTPASAVAQFGDAAGQQLERLTTLIEAVLALARSERDPADVAVTLRRVASLCSASASSADALVRVHELESTRSMLTRVNGDAVRLALTAPMLEIVSGADRMHRESDVICTLTSDEASVTVVIAATGRRAVMPDVVGNLVRLAGVRWIETELDLSLTFPSA